MRQNLSALALATCESKRRVSLCLLGAVLLAGLLVPWSLVADGLDALSVGIFPRRDAATTRSMFTPLMEQLGRELALEVRLEVAPDFDAFWSRLQEKQYDLVHFNQYHYLRAHQRFGYRAILMNEELGRAEIRSVIWVRSDGDVHRPADLKGKKIVFGGGRHAMVSHIMAMDLLRQHGLAEDDYLALYARNPVSAMRSLYYRQGVAAGAGDMLPLLFRDSVRLDAFKSLLKSQPVAHLPWAVNRQLPDDLMEEIKRSLIGLKQSRTGRRLLSNAGLSGFVVAKDTDYDPHRRIVARILEEHY